QRRHDRETLAARWVGTTMRPAAIAWSFEATTSASRDGEILEVLGEAGGPPYVVRWSDDGHVSRIFPGSDAYVEHFVHRRARRPAAAARPGRRPPKEE
ncbi:MAG: DUF1918 domain-containing protein, partial [Actinomycetota bacterium]